MLMPDRKAALIRNGADFAGLKKTLLPVLGALIMLLVGCRGLGTSPAPPPPPPPPLLWRDAGILGGPRLSGPVVRWVAAV